MANSVGKGDEEGDPDGSGNARSVRQVPMGQVGKYTADGAVPKKRKFRLRCHGSSWCACFAAREEEGGRDGEEEAEVRSRQRGRVPRVACWLRVLQGHPESNKTEHTPRRHCI